MAEEKEVKESKTKKLADPVAATIDPASQQLIRRAQELGIETAFDRAVTLKPCNIGTQGICCKNCGMGPCRLPLPKSGIEGKDDRKGLYFIGFDNYKLGGILGTVRDDSLTILKDILNQKTH